jgi:uncharacterized protein YcbX
MSADFQLDEINIYPIKSLGGVRLDEARLTGRGLQHDRRWMLVDPTGQFLTQRECPAMARLQVILHRDQLVVQPRHHPAPSLKVPLKPASRTRIPVRIWKHECLAESFPAPVDDWFSRHLQRPCRLVYMPDDVYRPVDSPWGKPGELVSFADGFPCLIIGRPSLQDLNRRLSQPVAMDRFRTNFVFSGGPPGSEDSWQRIRIGDVIFRVVKPCSRCVITTLDPQTGQFGDEPLRTLASYRRQTGGVMFGQNLIHESVGRLATGMNIEVLA